MARSNVRRRSGLPARRTTPQRKSAWGRFSAVGTVSSDQPQNYDLMADMRSRLGSDLVGTTVVRIRGQIYVQSEAPSTIIFGVRQTEQGANLIEEHGVFLYPYLDWMMFKPFNFGATNITEGETQSQVYDVDVRSSRKIEEIGETLMFSVGTDGATGGGQAFRVYLSYLVKLS